ncbi:TPA: LytTR family transcriptional regulator, partial [Streptococcus pneumoniae]|nr:LytTR family transcriptional regulator [Streptococcus pneumoniae]HEU8435679.1 LytTR family transcriptional regulator [Streptococcus pneumoniae]
MKVELQISETYEEEKLIVQAPQPTDKVQKVIEFAENLDQREKIKGKSDDQVYLVEIGKI